MVAYQLAAEITCALLREVLLPFTHALFISLWWHWFVYWQFSIVHM